MRSSRMRSLWKEANRTQRSYRCVTFHVRGVGETNGFAPLGFVTIRWACIDGSALLLHGDVAFSVSE